MVEWLTANRLTLNVDKTVALLFTNRTCNFDTDRIFLCGHPVTYQSEGKFLGVLLDDKLKFHSHINHVCKKISKSVGIIFKLRDKLPVSSLTSLYYSIVYPYLHYCNLVWGGTYKNHLISLCSLQKKILRILTCSDYLAHTSPLFHRMKILKLEDINKYLLGIHMFNRLNSGELNIALDHSYDTRFAFAVRPQFQRLTLTQHSVQYAGPHLWNSLPGSLRCTTSLRAFKQGLKAYLISQYVEHREMSLFL